LVAASVGFAQQSESLDQQLQRLKQQVSSTTLAAGQAGKATVGQS
jgi:hypothetical protein